MPPTTAYAHHNAALHFGREKRLMRRRFSIFTEYFSPPVAQLARHVSSRVYGLKPAPYFHFAPAQRRRTAAHHFAAVMAYFRCFLMIGQFPESFHTLTIFSFTQRPPPPPAPAMAQALPSCRLHFLEFARDGRRYTSQFPSNIQNCTEYRHKNASTSNIQKHYQAR